MGLFGIFGGNKDNSEKEQKELPWKRLTSVDQLAQIVEESKTKSVAIFKHSTRCGISRMVLRNFEGTYDLDPENMHLYYLDLLAYRDVSDEVGFRFQVLHQSPQLIIIKNGIAVAHASHHGIRAEELVNFI
ncbi:MAG: bacillithiol system redox-active protein YtxJ [Flavobacteriaceae bacterium]|nr:bacillithiol system redox-active protein YtxJ [Flavobacteriaceae bacterium]